MARKNKSVKRTSGKQPSIKTWPKKRYSKGKYNTRGHLIPTAPRGGVIRTSGQPRGYIEKNQTSTMIYPYGKCSCAFSVTHPVRRHLRCPPGTKTNNKTRQGSPVCRGTAEPKVIGNYGRCKKRGHGNRVGSRCGVRR